jgi:hypothetical protein
VLLFDGPATAIRAGVRALQQHADSALGVHVAEVERDTPHLQGYGLSAAVALADCAPPGSVWATSTVRDLIAGSGVSLRAAGERALGPAGRFSVYAAIGCG